MSTCKNVTAASIAAPYQSELVQGFESVTAKLGRKPKLVGILANADEGSRMYAKSTAKACADIGIDFDLWTIGTQEDLSQSSEVEEAVIRANIQDDIDGIMIYFPIFTPAEDSYLQQVVAPAKDVEGLHFFFRFNLYHNIRFIKPSLLASGSSTSFLAFNTSSSELQDASSEEKPGLVKAILPCTSLAIVKCLEHVGVYNHVLDYGRRGFGKTITVINRSEVVGRPLAALLANDGALVYSVDANNIVEFTRRKIDNSSLPLWKPHYATVNSKKTLEECLAASDVVISGVPSASYKVPTAHLKDGVTALNFSSAKNFEADVKDRASIYVANVGKVTIAMLQRNLLRLVSYRKNITDSI